MKAQQIFDKVVEHLYTQGVTAVNSTGDCLYRMKDGRKCAAGCLIADHYYRRDMEGVSICNLTGKLPNYFTENLDLISRLQALHDSSDNLRTRAVKRRLYKVARRFNLDTKKLEEVYGQNS